MKIPQTAQDFIDTLRPVKKPSTCAVYFYKLKGFHAWLSEQRCTLESLDRPLMERWLKSLSDRALAPSSRASGILNVRSYLEWLFDQGRITVSPDDLLRSSDIPKIPNTLPKPYPKEIDQKLQRRFLESGTLYGDALFLMRRTGVRIGELVRLVPDCLEIDLHGNAFMRVPLGKLDNERLVPIDRQTREILERLKVKCQDGDPIPIVFPIVSPTYRDPIAASLPVFALSIPLIFRVSEARLFEPLSNEATPVDRVPSRECLL